MTRLTTDEELDEIMNSEEFFNDSQRADHIFQNEYLLSRKDCENIVVNYREKENDEPCEDT
jgi:hypothetical protein